MILWLLRSGGGQRRRSAMILCWILSRPPPIVLEMLFLYGPAREPPQAWVDEPQNVAATDPRRQLVNWLADLLVMHLDRTLRSKRISLPLRLDTLV